MCITVNNCMSLHGNYVEKATLSRCPFVHIIRKSINHKICSVVCDKSTAHREVK